MEKRKCAAVNCNALEFRSVGYCNRHKDYFSPLEVINSKEISNDNDSSESDVRYDIDGNKNRISSKEINELLILLKGAKQYWIVDLGKDEDEFVLKSLKHTSAPKILVINKIDLVEKPKLLSLISQAHDRSIFKEIIPVSALKDDGMEPLKGLIVEYLPEGPEYFPKNMITDCTESFLFAEIIREKVLSLTRLEVPHSVAVVIGNMEEQENGVVRIDATLYTEKDSQKKILIGQGGSMLKSIGRIARVEIEKRLGAKVYLKIFVKVKSNWRDQKQAIKELVYPYDSL